MILQGPQWQIGAEIGRGTNGAVFTAVSRDLPGTVVKGALAKILQGEADKLWSLRHPNIVRAHALLTTSEQSDDQQDLAYLVLDRLGPSLWDLEKANIRCCPRVCLSVCALACPICTHTRLSI